MSSKYPLYKLRPYLLGNAFPESNLSPFHVASYSNIRGNSLGMKQSKQCHTIRIPEKTKRAPSRISNWINVLTNTIHRILKNYGCQPQKLKLIFALQKLSLNLRWYSANLAWIFTKWLSGQRSKWFWIICCDDCSCQTLCVK